jgi:hypothetical protein
MLRAAHEEAVGERMSLDSLRRLSIGDKVLLAGSVILLVALFLPWWDNGFGVTANGFHDWGWLSFLALLLLAALFAVRTVVDESRRLPELSVSDPVAYMIGGVAEVVGAVVFWLTNNTRIMGEVRYGVFVAVVGGAVTIAGGYLKQVERAAPADGGPAAAGDDRGGDAPGQ